MQLHSARTCQPSPSPKEAVPYSSAALRQDLQRVRGAWDDCQANRDRNAIYGYLTAVYSLGSRVDRGRTGGRPGSPRSAFAAVGYI